MNNDNGLLFALVATSYVAIGFPVVYLLYTKTTWGKKLIDFLVPPAEDEEMEEVDKK